MDNDVICQGYLFRLPQKGGILKVLLILLGITLERDCQNPKKKSQEARFCHYTITFKLQSQLSFEIKLEQLGI